jgi:hypothetical protein
MKETGLHTLVIPLIGIMETRPQYSGISARRDDSVVTIFEERFAISFFPVCNQGVIIREVDCRCISFAFSITLLIASSMASGNFFMASGSVFAAIWH